MKRRGCGTIVALVVGVCAVLRPAAAQYCDPAIGSLVTALNTYDVITLEDLSTNSDIEGRTFIGRNFTNGNSANFATMLSAAPESTSVEVVGDIVAGNPLQVESGSLRIKGSTNGRAINFNGGGMVIPDPTLSNGPLTTTLQNGSSALAAIPPNNVATLPSGQPGPARFVVTSTNSCGVAVFNVAASALFSNTAVQQIELDPGSATAIVINVSGVDIDWTDGNMVSQFTSATWRARTVWNFYEATSIELGARNFMGALLAPLAAVGAAGVIDGSTAVRSLTTTSEVHLPVFNGDLSCLCNATPTATATGTATDTGTATQTGTATHTGTATATETGTATATATPVDTATATATPIDTATATATPADTATATATAVDTATATHTPVATASDTATATETSTATASGTATATATATATDTATAVATPTATDPPPSATATGTATQTGTATATTTGTPPSTATATVVPASATATSTASAIAPATSTSTAAPATATATAPPPTATRTRTRTPTVATATATGTPGDPVLQIGKSTTSSVAPGATLVFTIEFANVGGGMATGIVISDAVPANTRFNAAASSPGWSCADNSPPATVCEHTFADLPAGEGGTLLFAVTVDAGFFGSGIFNSVTIRDAEGGSAGGSTTAFAPSEAPALAPFGVVAALVAIAVIARRRLR